MKKNLLPLLLLLPAVFAACKKDHDRSPYPAELPAAIEGNWLLVKLTGGLGGGPHEITSRQELLFHDGKQELIINGVRQSISDYQLVKVDSTFQGSWVLKTDSLTRYFITLKNDTLCLAADLYDTMYAYYIRE